jgi:hypothetical protein
VYPYPEQTSDQSPESDQFLISAADRLHPAELARLRGNEARCVRYEYCVSVGVATLRRQSRVFYTDSWQARYLLGLPYSLLSLALGPWGVPWGVLLTLRAVWVNLSGGVNVTAQVVADPADSDTQRLQ